MTQIVICLFLLMNTMSSNGSLYKLSCMVINYFNHCLTGTQFTNGKFNLIRYNYS